MVTVKPARLSCAWSICSRTLSPVPTVNNSKVTEVAALLVALPSAQDGAKGAKAQYPEATDRVAGAREPVGVAVHNFLAVDRAGETLADWRGHRTAGAEVLKTMT